MTTTAPGPLTAWAKDEILGMKLPIRATADLELPPIEFIEMSIATSKATVHGSPRSAMARSHLASAALAHSAALIHAGILLMPLTPERGHRSLAKAFESAQLAAEQYLWIIDAFDDPMPFERAATAASFHNGSVLFSCGGNHSNAVMCWKLASQQIALLPENRNPAEDPQLAVQNAILRQGQWIGEL